MSSVAPWVPEHGEWMDELAAHPSAAAAEDAEPSGASSSSEQQQPQPQHSPSNSATPIKAKAHRSPGSGSAWPAASSNDAVPRGGGEKPHPIADVQADWTRRRDTALIAEFDEAATAASSSLATVAAASSSSAMSAPVPRTPLPGQIYSADSFVSVHDDADAAPAEAAGGAPWLGDDDAVAASASSSSALFPRLPLSTRLPSLPSLPLLPLLLGRGALPAAPPSPISRSGIGTALRRLPASAHGSFSAQSDDVQLLILSFLSNVELCRMCTVSQHCNDLASKERSWGQRCAFLKDPEAHVGVAIGSFIAHAVTIKGRWLRYRSWLLTRSKIEHEAAVRSLTHRRRMCVLHFLDGPFFCLVVGLCLLLGVTLTVMHVQQRHDALVRDHEAGVVSAVSEQESALSSVALFPYLLLIAFVTFVTALMCCARWDRNRRAPSSQACCHPRAYGGTLPLPGAGGLHLAAVDQEATGVVRNCMHQSNGDYPPQLRVTAAIMALIVLWAVLFLLRLGARIHWSWSLVFSPLYAAFAILLGWACFPLARLRQRRLRSRVQGCVALWCVLLGPLLTFAVLLAVRLSRGPLINVDPTSDTGSFGLSWLVVQVPLLLLHLLMIGFALMITIDERTPGPIAVYVCFFGPLLIFQSMIGSWADRGGWGHSPLRFTLLFIPLWLFLSMCVVVSCCMCVNSPPRSFQMALITERTPPREPLVM